MTQSAASTVDPQKWLATFQRWCPAVPMAEHVAFINSWIEVAGPHRVEWINAYIEQADNQQRRTGAWKIKRVKQRAEDMAKNPQRMPWLRKLRGSPDIDVVLKILRTAGRGLRAGEILRAFPRDRGMTLGALNNVLLGMKANDLIEQYSDGVYGIPRLGVEPYESGTRRIFKSALKVPKEEETTRAALCEATGWNRARVGAAINNLRDRGLFDPERIAVSAWARAKTEYNETIFNEKGKVFWAPEVSHSVPPDHVLFTSVTTLRHERAPVDHEAKERKIAWLKTLEGEDLKSGLVAMASELACDPADLAVRLSKSAQRYLREDAAREDWGKKVRVWMEQSPKRPPKSLPGLFKDAFNEGVSRRVCKDVIREAAAALMKISWSEAGAPKRG